MAQVEAISVLDIFKIGVGPSSSHTMGPWRAAAEFRRRILPLRPAAIEVHLYGSLAKTGRGHGTDKAVQLGLLGESCEAVDPGAIPRLLAGLAQARSIEGIRFDPERDIVFHFSESLPGHPNGMIFRAEAVEMTAYSVGGGFIVIEGEQESVRPAALLPYPFEKGEELEELAERHGLVEMLWANEGAFRPQSATEEGLDRVWNTMRECAWRGCRQEGVLPGGLNVRRRASQMSQSLLGASQPLSLPEWEAAIAEQEFHFEKVLKWVSAFALAVNEENAAMGRVVTAPTNGAAGVIPSVLLYGVLFRHLSLREAREFLLVAGAVGMLFKKGATISAALGGCQAEIGVSSAMAAAGLAHVRGGSPAQCLMAAEIAMEHHLGMTCDPIGGLVQIPCIERNSMGAMKAITAVGIALECDPREAKVPLDAVIRSMWQTALDMNSKYKETSEGGLAVQIPVSVSEC